MTKTDQGWVDEHAYATAVVAHWAYPALVAAMYQLADATRTHDREAIARAQKKVDYVKTLFSQWRERAQA